MRKENSGGKHDIAVAFSLLLAVLWPPAPPQDFIMQTFLPYANFHKSADVLDYRRHGKQRVEGRDTLVINTFVLYGKRIQVSKKYLQYLLRRYKNHPAVLMWRGYEKALKFYINVCMMHWREKGYINNMPFYNDAMSVEEKDLPWWLGDREFHKSHKMNLLRKNYDYYKKYFRREVKLYNKRIINRYQYYWPVTKENICHIT